VLGSCGYPVWANPPDFWEALDRHKGWEPYNAA